MSRKQNSVSRKQTSVPRKQMGVSRSSVKFWRSKDSQGWTGRRTSGNFLCHVVQGYLADKKTPPPGLDRASHEWAHFFFFSSLLPSSLELSDKQVYGP